MANQTKIIIHVYEGIVVAAYSNDPEVKVMMYDQDNIEAGDESPVNTDQFRELRAKRTGMIKGEHFTRVY